MGAKASFREPEKSDVARIEGSLCLPYILYNLCCVGRERRALPQGHKGALQVLHLRQGAQPEPAAKACGGTGGTAGGGPSCGARLEVVPQRPPSSGLESRLSLLPVFIMSPGRQGSI
jgi:hypothetical protein